MNFWIFFLFYIGKILFIKKGYSYVEILVSYKKKIVKDLVYMDVNYIIVF